MLVSSQQMIYRARVENYAIGCFNTSNLEITKAIIQAAEAQQSPVIIATSEKGIAYAGLETLADIIKDEAKKTKIPVALHLDHGASLATVEACLKAGYTSVMIDGSKLDLIENIMLTRQAVEMARAYKVPCEGELGSLGKTGENPGKETKARDVPIFVQRTGVDFLAVAIGSEHGASKVERLDFELLKKIHGYTGLPLVLHGASGVAQEDIKEAIKLGIAKINIDTDIRQGFVEDIRRILKTEPDIEDPRQLLGKVIVDLQKLIEEKIKLFGSSNKV